MTSPRIIHAYVRHRYALLFYSLILTLGAGPLLAALDVHRHWIRLFLELNLFAGVFGVTSTRRWRALPWLLAFAVAVRLLALIVDIHRVEVATRPLIVGIGLAAAVGALRFALQASRVATEHVYAALSAYLLVGLFAGVLHFEIEQAWPGSYTSGGTALTDFPLFTAIYFSFVTLATLGYGDIVPRTDVARGVTLVEAVVGQLYLAVLMARLVSIYARASGEEHHA